MSGATYDPALFISAIRAAIVARSVKEKRSEWLITIKPQYVRGELKGYALLVLDQGDSFILTEDMARKYG